MNVVSSVCRKEWVGGARNTGRISFKRSQRADMMGDGDTAE